MSRTPSFSRGTFPEIGKRPERIRVSVSNDMLRDIEREKTRLGYDDIADWLFDVVLEKLYGEECVRRLYQAQVERIQKLLANSGPVDDKNVPSGGNP